MGEETADRAISKKQIAALIRARNTSHKRVQSINGEIGERIKHAADNAGLNRQAFGLIAKLARMDEDKRDDFLRSFDLYRQYAEEENLFGEEHVGDMVDEAERTAAAEAGHVTDNVTQLKRGIKELLDEEAGGKSASSSRGGRKADGLGDADASGSYDIKH